LVGVLQNVCLLFLSIFLHIIENFEVDVAQKALGKIAASIRRLEAYPVLGVALGRMIDVPTDYMYKKNKGSFEPDYFFVIQ